jgi:formylglycine-generating enzyme required for sulfatase activity
MFKWLQKPLRSTRKSDLTSPKIFTFQSITLDRSGKLLGHAAGQAIQVEQHLPGNKVLELVEIPGGSFIMGALREGGYVDERPLHQVFLSGFWLGKYPVTQAQWQAVMGKQCPGRFRGPNLPVENICWNEAMEFCLRLSRMTGRDYRLPSEAQWEYACRAGTTTPFSLGETITTEYANYVGAHTYRDEPRGVYRRGTTPVGSFPPNPWGLYDMHGQVWEFCADAWHDDYSNAPADGSPQVDNHPSGQKRPRFYVARGGSWHEPPNHCRSAMRLRVEEDERMEFYGFRVMLAGDLSTRQGTEATQGEAGAI